MFLCLFILFRMMHAVFIFSWIILIGMIAIVLAKCCMEEVCGSTKGRWQSVKLYKHWSMYHIHQARWLLFSILSLVLLFIFLGIHLFLLTDSVSKWWILLPLGVARIYQNEKKRHMQWIQTRNRIETNSCNNDGNPFDEAQYEYHAAGW